MCSEHCSQAPVRLRAVVCCLLLQAQPKRSSSSTQQHIPVLIAQQPQQPGSKAIPEGFMIPPDEQEKRLAAMKSQLLTALKPTPDTVSAVAQDSTLMSGQSLAHMPPAFASCPAGTGLGCGHRAYPSSGEYIGSLQPFHCRQSAGSAALVEQPAGTTNLTGGCTLNTLYGKQ
jgi:hypothetical protein